jgi:hypothetical protein
LLITGSISVLMLLVIGLVPSFWVAVSAITIQGLAEAASRADPAGLPQRHDPFPATRDYLVLRLIDRQCGGIVAQPVLGKSADIWGYQVSYLFSAAGTALALPFIARARMLNTPADHETAALPASLSRSAQPRR